MSIKTLNTENALIAETLKNQNNNMEIVMEAVTDENTPISWAAKDHGMPNSTLHD